MRLTAFYDLATSPPTFDFVSFLLNAEMRREACGADSTEVRILPGPNNGFRQDNLPPQCPETRRRMLHQIVVPMTDLLPSCAGVVVQTDRSNDHGRSFGHGEKCYGLGHLLRAARAGVYPLRAAGSAPQGDYVTITLRECSYHPTRNASLPEWVKVGRCLSGSGVRVIFVRDTEKADEPLDGFETDPRASVDLLYRADLYAGARLNLFTSNGPAWMCLFMGAPTFICKMFNPGVKMASPQVFASRGLPPGSLWPNLRPRQHVSWDGDEFDRIMPHVERLLQC